MDERTVITIGREFGSGGHEIGMKLAEKLGIKCYDKELLQVAAKESGLCEELFASQDEKPTNSFLYSLVMDTYSLGYSNSYVDMPINHKVFLAQFDAIKKLAAKESCVIVGRCADYALEDDPFAVSVWIKASLDERIKRIKKLYELNDSKAADLIQKTDCLLYTSVYCVNTGYTIFCPVEIIDENNEYYIVKQNLTHGISVYDRIILDALKYQPNEMIY